MANYTGANVINAGDVSNYQADIYEFGFSCTSSEVTFFIAETTNHILRELRIRWWAVYKTNFYTDITVLNTAEMVDTKVNLDQFKRAGAFLFLYKFFLPTITKFRPEADKDRFERMIEFYRSEFINEFQAILEDGVEYDSDESGTIDWTQVIANNQQWSSDSEFDTTYSDDMHRSKRIIRASVNHHDWTGVLSTYNRTINDNLKFTTGVDVRSYAGEHYREVVNLLGVDYYVHHYAKAGETGTERMRDVGGLIDYHNTGYHDWYGGWAQAEYSTDSWSAVLSGAQSVSRYQRQEQYNETEGDEFSKVLIFPGNALKLGFNFNVNENLNMFLAAGNMSKAPKFSNAYLSYSNTPNTGAQNESITSMDVGVSYRSDLFDVTTTYYNNTWEDKSLTLYSAPDIYNITGLSANHSGVEVEADVRPMDMLSVDAALSFGNWAWGENVDATFSSDYDRTNTTEVKLYTDGLKVGFQPQTQMAFGLNLMPMDGLRINTTFQMNDNFYAGFDPADRVLDTDDPQALQDAVTSVTDVVKLDAFNLMNLHLSYKMNLMGTDLVLGAHVLNALDTEYVSYAEDQGFEDDGSNSAPKVFYGSGRQIRMSFKVSL